MGELLVDADVIDEHQLAIALAEQKRTGGKLGRILIDLGLSTEEAISRALASQTGVDHIDLDAAEIEPAATERVDEAIARRHQLIAVRFEGTQLLVAMANPTDIVAIDAVERSTDLFVRVVSASRRQILRAIDRAYRSQAQHESGFETALRHAMSEIEEGGDAGSRGAIAALMEEVMTLAMRDDATDIHLEPDENVVRVRFRVDGEMRAGPTMAVALQAPLVARVKVLADLDLAETRVPQDGKIRFAYQNRKVDMRVSTFPAVTGESVVIRILDRGRRKISLETLGFTDDQIETLRRIASRPNGLMLASGPTGSGKSTTLYALLSQVNSSARKIITLEDPVEYDLPLVTQCQINERAGLTFAAGLRSILRHDPDVILVGEMRDTETAGMALRAALTGHFVFSTLHTNDAVRTISRLRDMGVEPFLIASCLVAVVGQRLVRLVCTHCAAAYEPRDDELLAVGIEPGAPGNFKIGKGCDRCHGTGTHGREALFEVLEIGPEIAQLIGRDAAVDEIEAAARGAGLRSFREVAQERAAAGVIPLEEVARVTVEH